MRLITLLNRWHHFYPTKLRADQLRANAVQGTAWVIKMPTVGRLRCIVEGSLAVGCFLPWRPPQAVHWLKFSTNRSDYVVSY
jgi:hypothetical protein